MIRVSILVPVYGVEKFIERCARSLMEQTYPNVEYIFVDDCSPDNSFSILSSVTATYHRADTTIIRHEKNKGVSAARRTALLAATGDYVLNVDGDDYLETDAIEQLVRQVEETGADVVRLNCFFEWDKTRKEYHGPWSANSREYTRLLLNTSVLPGVCLHLIKRSLFINHNILPIEGLNLGDDFVLTPRLCFFANKVGQVDKPLYHYIQTNSSSYTTTFNKKKVENLRDVGNVLHDFFVNEPDLLYAINEGMWQKKVEMMLTCHYKEYTIVDTLPTWFSLSTKTMNLQQKLAAPLVEHKLWCLLSIYSSVSHFIFQIVQKLKGR